MFFREDGPGLRLVVGGVTAHPEGPGGQEAGTVPRAAFRGQQGRGRVDIEDVVAVAGEAGHAIGGPEGLHLSGAVFLDGCAEGDTVVLQDDDHRHLEDRRQVEPFVEGGRPAGAVADPGQRDAGLAALPKRQADTGEDRHQIGHQAVRRDDTERGIAGVQVPAAGDLIAGPQIGLEHLRHRHPHFVTGAGVADHRADLVALEERMHAADRHRLLARSEPRFGDDPLPDPALESDVVQAEPDHPLVQPDQLTRSEPFGHGASAGVPAHRRAVLLHHCRVRLEVDVLRRIVEWVALHRRSSSFISRTARSMPTSEARAMIAWPMFSSSISGIRTMRRTFW